MTITLTHEESEKYFYNALCNGLGQVCQYGLQVDYDQKAYDKAKATLQKKSPQAVICYEDVFMEMLRQGNNIVLKDIEGDEDDAVVTLKEVHERVQLTPIHYLTEMIEEEDDADTADQILQTVFLQEIVYG